MESISKVQSSPQFTAVRYVKNGRKVIKDLVKSDKDLKIVDKFLRTQNRNPYADIVVSDSKISVVSLIDNKEFVPTGKIVSEADYWQGKKILKTPYITEYRLEKGSSKQNREGMNFDFFQYAPIRNENFDNVNLYEQEHQLRSFVIDHKYDKNFKPEPNTFVVVEDNAVHSKSVLDGLSTKCSKLGSQLNFAEKIANFISENPIKSSGDKSSAVDRLIDFHLK